MPTEKPAICLPNTPKSSQRSIHCRFEHDGLDASIEVSNVVNPQILPRAGRAYAEGVLLSLAAAADRAIMERHVQPEDLHHRPANLDVQASSEHGELAARIHILASVRSHAGAGVERYSLSSSASSFPVAAFTR